MFLCCFLLLTLHTTPTVPAAPRPVPSDTNPTIPKDVLEAAVKRAAAEVRIPTTVIFNFGEPTGQSVLVTQLPEDGRGLLAGTVVIPKPPATATETVGIAIFPAAIYRSFPGAKEDRRYLENMLYLILCHEMEHMPECPNGPTGGVPPHPTDNPPGPGTSDNKCHTLRQYARDAQRACDKAREALESPNLCGSCTCKVVHQYCKAYHDAKKRAGKAVYASAGLNCNPPVTMPSCPTCPDLLVDCPKHRYTPQ